MRRRLIHVAGVALVLVVQVAPAHAKGPVGATIEGAGVTGILEIDQRGELGQGTAMSQLVEVAGFFDLTFGESKKVSAGQPTKTLGKDRLVISWDMGGGSAIVQEIYFDAAGGPVTHVAAGQQFWEEGWETVGGWMSITGDIATPLIELGVDQTALTSFAEETKSVVKATSGATGPEVAAAPQPVEKAAPVEAKPAAAPASAAPGTARSAAPSGAAVAPLVAAAIALTAIIGAGIWTRLRHSAPQ